MKKIKDFYDKYNPSLMTVVIIVLVLDVILTFFISVKSDTNDKSTLTLIKQNKELIDNNSSLIKENKELIEKLKH